MARNALLDRFNRLNPRERQLSRFYEPLVLLYTLGSTRGEHTAAALPPDENICELPLKELRRRFLNELAYVCDYNKGGDTVTAIGLESTPQRYVFWVGANTSPQKRIVPFVELPELHAYESVLFRCFLLQRMRW